MQQSHPRMYEDWGKSTSVVRQRPFALTAKLFFLGPEVNASREQSEKKRKKKEQSSKKKHQNKLKKMHE